MSPMNNIELDLQPKEWKDVADIYKQCQETSMSLQDTKTTLISYIKAHYSTIPESSLEPIVSKLIQDYASKASSSITQEINLLDSDLRILQSSYHSIDILLNIHHDLEPKYELPVKKLLLALVASYRANFHSSGWIKYDKKQIIYLAGLSKLPVMTQEKLFNYLHTSFALQMRVVGSNNPIPCFKFDWIEVPSQEPDAPVLESHNFGILSPDNISSLLEDNAHRLFIHTPDPYVVSASIN